MSRQRSPVAKVLSSVSAALRELAVDWYLFGAQAALLYGAARLTADVDITVHLGASTTSSLVEALEQHDFALRVVDDAFVRATRVLPVVHTPTGIPVDIVLGGPGLEELFLSRATARRVGGVSVPVAHPEDIVVMKVLAGREKDRADVIGMLRARHSEIVLARVRDTLRLVEQALDQSDLIPAFEALLSAAGVEG